MWHWFMDLLKAALAAVVAMIGCSDKYEGYQKARAAYIQKMEDAGCPFCCGRQGIEDIYLCPVSMSREYASKCMFGFGPECDAYRSEFEEAYGLTVADFAAVDREVTFACENGDAEKCRWICGGREPFCVGGHGAQPRDPTSSCSDKVTALSSRTVATWNAVRGGTPALVVEADAVRRRVAGFAGLGASDTLLTPTLVAYQLNELVLGEEPAKAELRAKTLWQIALAKLAEDIADRLPDDEFSIPTDAYDGASKLLENAGTVASLLSSPGVHNAAQPLKDYSNAARDVLIQTNIFKGNHARLDYTWDHYSGFFDGISLGVAAIGAGAEFNEVQELVQTAKYAFALMLVVDALQIGSAGQHVLGVVLTNWQMIPQAFKSDAQDNMAYSLLATAVQGLGMIAMDSVLLAPESGGSSLIAAAAAVGVGAVLGTLLEPYEYLRSYQYASLLYTAAYLLDCAAPTGKTQLVRAEALHVANELMDDHVVGKVVPHVINPLEWPVIHDIFADHDLAVKVPEGSEDVWRDYLDGYYGRFRLNLWVIRPVIWPLRSEGKLEDPIEKLLECIFKR